MTFSQIYHCDLCQVVCDEQLGVFGVSVSFEGLRHLCNPVVTDVHICGVCAKGITESYGRWLAKEKANEKAAKSTASETPDD